MKVNLHGTGPGTMLGDNAPRAQVPLRGAAHPMGVLLFGKRPPKKVDKRKHPKLAKALRKLQALAEQIAPWAGADPEELSLELCEGNNASITREGTVFIGVTLLERHQRDDDFLVAVLGHELGHRPWSWPDLELSGLTRAERDALYREEEAKADRFAGRMLAELGADPEAICRFLIAEEHFEGHAPADYYPATVRAQHIREAFQRRRAMINRGGVAGIARRARDLR